MSTRTRRLILAATVFGIALVVSIVVEFRIGFSTRLYIWVPTIGFFGIVFVGVLARIFGWWEAD
jgi:hypothetical protein